MTRDLRPGVDALLRNWPAPADQATVAARCAEQILGKLGADVAPSSQAALSDDALFAAPLPEGAEDAPAKASNSAPPSSALPSSAPVSSAGADSRRGRASFKELAKMAGEGAPTSTRTPAASPGSSPGYGVSPASPSPASSDARSGAPGAEGRSAFPSPASMDARSAASAIAGGKKPVSGSFPAAATSSAVLLPPSGDPNDSGFVDLSVAAALDPTGAERAKTTPLAASGLFDDDAPSASAKSAPPAAGATAPTLGSLQGPAAAAVAAARSPVPVSIVSAGPPQSRTPLIVAAAFVGISVLAAAGVGGLFVYRARQETKALALALEQQKALSPDLATAGKGASAAALDPTSAAGSPSAAAASTTPGDAPAPSATGAVANANDPLLAPKTAPDAVQKGPSKAGKPSVGEKLAAATPAAPAADPPAQTAAAKPSSGGALSLGEAITKEVGPADTAKQPASAPAGPQFAAGSVPQKPSPGAVSGAIGSVLPGARACLGPDDPVSRATVDFSSSGNVSRVAVSGGAAGKPAEACIKAALGKAHVSPFAEPSYTFGVTVRP